jgi:hypothetical protein
VGQLGYGVLGLRSIVVELDLVEVLPAPVQLTESRDLLISGTHASLHVPDLFLQLLSASFGLRQLDPELSGAFIGAPELLRPYRLLRCVAAVRIDVLRVVVVVDHVCDRHLLPLGDNVVLEAGILAQSLDDVLGLRVVDLVEDLIEAGLHVRHHPVQLLDPVVLLRTHKVQVRTLVLRLLQLTLESSVSEFELFLKLDDFDMQLVVLLDYSLILLLQRLVVHVVIGYLLLQTLIYLLELLKPFGCFQ